MVRGKNRIPYWIDWRLTGLAEPDYDATISFGLPIEPEDSQYGKYRSKRGWLSTELLSNTKELLLTIYRTIAAGLRRDERGVGLLLILIVVAVLAVAIGGGLTAFFVLRTDTVSEQTAKFLPAETQIYYSVNLRLGTDQLKKIRDIVERFGQHPNFQEQIDVLYDEAEDETGVDLREEVLPWLGPELAVGVIDVVESAIAGAADGIAQYVVFVGTRDSEATSVVLEDFLSFRETKEDIEYERDTYREFLVWREPNSDERLALTDNYVLFASDRDLMEDTIDRIKSEDSSPSLFESDRFQAARDAVSFARFSMLYIDTDTIWKDALRLADQDQRNRLRDLFGDLIPEWAAVTTSFVDSGLKLAGYTPSTEDGAGSPAELNSVAAAGLLPQNSIALVSFVLDPDLDKLRTQLGEQDAASILPGLFGGRVSPEDIPSDISNEFLDELVGAFNETTGLDLEREVLGWMAGEFAPGLAADRFPGASRRSFRGCCGSRGIYSV